jgi:hypothetical protein
VREDVVKADGELEEINKTTQTVSYERGGSNGNGNGHGGYGYGGNGNGSGDLSAYPILTEEVSLATSPTGFTAGRAGDVGTRASAAIQEVLGWRPTRDGRGFNAALTQCFGLKEVEGHVEWTYTPRGYSARADLGAVTGVQASLVMRARTVVNSVVRPLIESLTPLWAGAVAEDYESLRTLVLREADEIVAELGQEGGPRLQYLDDTFLHLLGPSVVGALQRGDRDPLAHALIHGTRLPGVRGVSPTSFKGHVYQLQERMGLNRSNILTVNDEGVVTSFLTAADALAELYIAYNQVRRELRPAMGRRAVDGVQPFLGTQLIWVSRAFAAVGDATNELVFALDSVFVDASERQIIEFDPGSGAISLAETLDWLLAVSNEQGPQAIQDSGIDGLMAMNRTVTSLQQVVDGLTALIAQGTSPSRAMSTPRVTRALDKVAEKLSLLVNLTGQISLSVKAEQALESPPESMAETAVLRG